MVKVVANGVTIADSNETVVVEGNHYFPPKDVKTDLFSTSSTSSTCPWKGKAAYYSATIEGKTINDIAWYYPAPNDAAANIKNHVAFYKNKVSFEESAPMSMMNDPSPNENANTNEQPMLTPMEDVNAMMESSDGMASSVEGSGEAMMEGGENTEMPMDSETGMPMSQEKMAEMKKRGLLGKLKDVFHSKGQKKH